MKKMKWSLLLICSTGLIVFGVLQYQYSGYADQAPAEGQPKATADGKKAEAGKGKMLPTVKVETVQTAELTKIMELTGSVTPTRIAKLASPAEGPVEVCTTVDCKVREGDSVKTGQKLFQIGRNTAAMAELVSARQALQEQTAELQRTEQLAEAGAIPAAQVDTVRSQHENAKAQLVKSQESTTDYSVTVPWDGIVAKILVTEGEYVAPRTVLAEIFDPKSFVVQFAVPEAQSTEVALGMAVLIGLDAHPGKTLKAEITRVFPNLDEKMRTRTVEATLRENIDLLPGMFARVKVVLASLADAVTVPAYSLIPAPNGGYTAFVVEDGKAARRKLNTGLEMNGRVQVLSGLKAGDKLIVAGQEKLKDGAPLKVMKPVAGQADTAAKEGTRL
jgi:membrane fusion protein (multidrug efflux system)